MRKRSIIIIHITFWTIYILFGVLINVATHNQLKVTGGLYLNNFLDPFTWIGYGRTIITCYLSLWVFSYLFSRNKYLLGAASLLALIFIDIILRYTLEQKIIGPVFNLWQFPPEMSFRAYVVENVFFSSLGIFICFFLKIVNDYFITEKARQEKISMELQFLKSQINPHFLFNSFNNLYGLALTEPQKTPDVILKLAELTRYMIYESNEDRVLLTKEINYLQNLIELEKLRYEDKIYLEINLEHEERGYLIAPLLLISFVENAFKHGELHNQQAPIQIKLEVKDKILNFFTSNQIVRQNKDGKSGFGLKNVQRRLDLLYEGRSKLHVLNNGESYISQLMLILD